MRETRHPNGSDLDNRHHFGARARHAGDSPAAVCTADMRALAFSLRSKLQARVYQAWIFYRKASARGSSEIAARSPGMVVVEAVVSPTRARAFRLSISSDADREWLPSATGPGGARSTTSWEETVARKASKQRRPRKRSPTIMVSPGWKLHTAPISSAERPEIVTIFQSGT
jgi:hypothetical protein